MCFSFQEWMLKALNLSKEPFILSLIVLVLWLIGRGLPFGFQKIPPELLNPWPKTFLGLDQPLLWVST